MEFFECPECKRKIDSVVKKCPFCGFDIQLYQASYERILEKKLQEYKTSMQGDRTDTQMQCNSGAPRCPTCGSSNLTKITTIDRAINIAMFGILGNKRKYQWHCNNCKSDF